MSLKKAIFKKYVFKLGLAVAGLGVLLLLFIIGQTLWRWSPRAFIGGVLFLSGLVLCILSVENKEKEEPDQVYESE